MRRCAASAASSIRKIALIGFCGAPWTVATYMVAGQGTPDQAPARMMAYRHPEAFAKIIDVLVENSIQYLLGQLKAGADVLQIFDTWAGVLPPREFARWSIEPTRRIVEGVRGKVPDAKIIGFPRGAGALLPGYVEATGVDAVSIDWAAEPSLIRERVQNRVAVQGNLDPLVLIAGGAALDRADRRRAVEFRRRPADLQPRPRHPAGNPDRACRADAEAGAGVSRDRRYTGRLRSMISAAPLARSSSPTARPSSRGRSAGPEREASMNSAAGFIQHRGGQRHLRALDGGKSGDRRIAVAVEHPQHLALGVGAAVRGEVIDRGQNTPRLPIVGGAFHRDDALARPPAAFPESKIHRRCGRQGRRAQARSAP